MGSQYNDWKRNPTPQALLNPWTKWVKRNVNFSSIGGDKPVRKGVRFQREIQQYISSPAPDESTCPSASTHIRHEECPPRPPQPPQPPSPDKLLPLLTKDDKYYLIGQKLSSLLNQEQQKRLLRDALDAGKLPPGTNAGSNCICPDIMVDIQNMIREEFDHGLAQAQRMVMQPANNVFVINQGLEKPLPGIPPGEWSGPSVPYGYPNPYTGQGSDMSTNSEVYYSNGYEVANVLPPPVAESRQHQKLELTSLRFPKPGIEPFLHCGLCQTDHPTRLFSPAQRRLPPGLRKCIAREGYVRLCAHKVVTWGLVEACLLRGLESQDWNQDYEDHVRQQGHGSFTFTCNHPSHPRAPAVTIYTNLPRPDIDDGFDDPFGRVVLKWTSSQPTCSTPFYPDIDLSTPDNNVLDSDDGHMYHRESLSDLPEDGSSYLSKNVICPGPSYQPLPTSEDNISLQQETPQADSLHVPALQLPRSHVMASPRPESRSSFRASSDLPSPLSPSYPRSSYSSYNTGMGGSGTSRPGSSMTDHDCGCGSHIGTCTSAYTSAAHTPEAITPRSPGTGRTTPTSGRMPMSTAPSTPTTNITNNGNKFNISELAINAVDMASLDIDEIIQAHTEVQQSQSQSQAQRYHPPDAPNHTNVRINPSTEWYAAVHPDSYSLDKWAKEGLFGLRWCAEAECKSYLAITKGQTGGGVLKGRSVHRGCRLGGGSCV
ncbi:hypothetical protein V8F20_010748 [Naviculisporaceae sp. PSN 640]